MAQGLYKMSPFKFWQALASPAGLSVIGGALGAFGGMKASRRARAEQGRARTAMDASRQRWMEQDLSNPYANMENVYEDLTVNQQAAQFQSQQAAQSRADILSGLQGAAGGAGGGGGGGAAPGAPVTQHGGNVNHTHTLQGGADVGNQVAQAVVAEVVPAVNQAVNQAITGIQHDASGNHVPSQGTASNQAATLGGMTAGARKLEAT